MKKVLYISNIEVPYRNAYFNKLSESVDLTVVFERRKSSNRNSEWAKSVKSSYNKYFLNGIKVKNEYSIDFKIFKYLFSKKYDVIIFGCFNSPIQIISILIMRILRKKYVLNIDGNYFLDEKSFKSSIKKFIIKGAYKYLVAGEYPSREIAKYVKSSNIYTYHFSSLSDKEIVENSRRINKNCNNTILVVGQYFDYKGLDLALSVAKLDINNAYLFVGSNNRNNLLRKKAEELNLNNVDIVPFMDKKDLFKEYQSCKCLLLPSRKECWGLVVNEAASFGCPIIATDKCGSAYDFLDQKWIAKSEDIGDIFNRVNRLNENEYDKEQLIEKSLCYSIEKSVEDTLNMLDSN